MNERARRKRRLDHRRRIVEPLILAALVTLLSGAIAEFYNIASGTGTWYAAFSAKWFAALAAFCLACLGLIGVCVADRWRQAGARWLIKARSRPGPQRIMIAAVFVLAPVLVLQYTPWGVVLRGPYLRLLLWALCIAGVAWTICADRYSVWTTQSLLGAMLLSGSALVVGAAFTLVTSYPFSLGWSEGNRLWDYSLMFGRSLYRLDGASPPVAYLDIGRQIIGGLPFLVPRVSILGARLWLGLVSSIPYLLLGLLAFLPRLRGRATTSIFGSLFGLLFLSQGPIHAPLVICAILVLCAWRLPVWWAAALMAVSGYFAEASRFTWMFAPAMWAVMLEFGGATLKDRRIPGEAWRRAIILGIAGLLGSGIAFSGLLAWIGTSVGSSASVSTSQALLWYRLLPNATYGDGILIGLLKAAGPLVVVLAVGWSRYGQRIRMQALVIGNCLLAFLIVGLVVSTKIGGGGDLHNLDMFLIGLFLTAAILRQAAGEQWFKNLLAMPYWSQGLLALAILLPAYAAMMSLQPLSFASEAEWVSVLAGVERPKDLGSLPGDDIVESSLDQIRAAVAEAAAQGPVLFMDQRQLLTFGFLPGVDLVSEYEKKRLMDEALSENEAYFSAFYQDLARRRFALIVSSPLRTPIKDSEYGFGEENNAWVRWVARPILCYYRELDTLNEVKVELLAPREDNPECASALPGGRP